MVIAETTAPVAWHSRHLFDQVEGGPSDCGMRMAPISIAVLRSGDWMIIHRCAQCLELTSNPVSRDDNQLLLMRMAVRPLAQPPFRSKPSATCEGESDAT